jgi:hypothetical protein
MTSNLIVMMVVVMMVVRSTPNFILHRSYHTQFFLDHQPFIIFEYVIRYSIFSPKKPLHWINADPHQGGDVISTRSSNYCPDRLAEGLVKKGTVFVDSSCHFFNWLALGIQCGVCFNTVPPNVSFLLGPLCAEHTLNEQRRSTPSKRTEEEDE